MKTISVDINNAKIEGFSVTLRDSKPEISATIGLFAGEKRISSFSLRTTACYSESVVFEAPPAMIGTIIDICDQLETILAEKCETALMQIGFDNA